MSRACCSLGQPPYILESAVGPWFEVSSNPTLFPISLPRSALVQTIAVLQAAQISVKWSDCLSNTDSGLPAHPEKHRERA